MKAFAWLAFALLIPAAFADQWNSPESRAFPSPNGHFILRVVPGHIHISGEIPGLERFNLPPDTQPTRSTMAQIFELTAKGDRYQKIREFSLLNQSSPVDACISDLGEVYTFDDWGSMGRGLVVVCYSADGKLKKEFTLEDLIPAKPRAEIEENHRSVSSTWWRKDSGRIQTTVPHFGMGYIVVITDILGGNVVIIPSDTITAKYYPAEKESK